MEFLARSLAKVAGVPQVAADEAAEPPVVADKAKNVSSACTSLSLRLSDQFLFRTRQRRAELNSVKHRY